MNKWSETDMENALLDIATGELSIRRAGLKYGIPESSLRFRKEKIKNFPPAKRGRKRKFPTMVCEKNGKKDLVVATSEVLSAAAQHFDSLSPCQDQEVRDFAPLRKRGKDWSESEMDSALRAFSSNRKSLHSASSQNEISKNTLRLQKNENHILSSSTKLTPINHSFVKFPEYHDIKTLDVAESNSSFLCLPVAKNEITETPRNYHHIEDVRTNKSAKKKATSWSERDMEKALAAIASRKSSIRRAGRKYGIPESSLRFRMQQIKNFPSVPKGSQRELSAAVESVLAKCVAVLCQNGFNPSVPQMPILIQEFLVANNLETRFRDEKPGVYWFYSFMKRHKLNWDKVNITNSGYKRFGCIPYLLKDFYNLLERNVNEHNLEPDQVWMLAETYYSWQHVDDSLFNDHENIEDKNETRQPNASVLAACSAAGEILPPFIIFRGKKLPSNFRHLKALCGTQYACSTNGYMNRDIFQTWFTNFLKSFSKRPLLLLVDGHLTHISLNVIKFALDNNVIILKLPPNAVDAQPLYRACFAPLYLKWKEVLQEYHKATMKRAEFVKELCGLWRSCLYKENVISGFTLTGIYPVDASKSDIKNKTVLQSSWKRLKEAKAEIRISPPRGVLVEVTEKSPQESVKSTEPLNGLCSCSVCEVIGPKPTMDPGVGMSWVPVWSVQSVVPSISSERTVSQTLQESLDITPTTTQSLDITPTKIKSPIGLVESVDDFLNI